MVNKLFSIVFLVLQVSQVSSFPGSAIDANLTEQRHLRFPPKLDCNKLKQGNKITVQKIVRKRCTSLAVDKGTDYYRFIMDEKAQVSVDDWNSFSAGLQSIADVHFIFNGSSLAAINFPSLKTIKQSHFKIERNEQLTSINVTMNSLVDNLNADITISNNPKLETVTLAGYGISGSVWITENRQLKTIDMDTVSLLHANEFYIENNEMLKQIKMGSLTIFNGNDFKLRGNKALEKFELPKMDSFSAANFTSIAKNDKLSIITFNSIKMGSTTEIVQNKKLTAIHTKAHYPGVSKNFILRGNPNLPQKILDYYRNNTYIERERNDIQVFGECIFDEVIKNFADLDDCIIINSAVKFTSSTAGDITNNQLKEINGDVNLAGLCREPVNFLENVKINGIIKSDVCKFQLTNHQVDSSKCTAKTCVSIMPVSPIATTSKTTAKSKSTPSRPVVKPTKATPSGSLNSTEVPPAFGKNTDKTGGSSKVGIICGAVAGAVILILLILILMCCCVPVPAGGGRNGKVKMYKRVLPWWNKVGTDASSSKGSLTSASSHKTSARKSDVQKGEGEPLLRQKTKEKVSRVPIRQPAPSQAEREMERLLPEPEMRTARGFPSFASLMATYSARAPTVSREPSVSGRAPTDPILDSISARPPSEREEERATLTARLTPGTLPTVPQGPERFIVTKDGEVLRQPRINYQHELLARMEDFFGNEENYEDLLEEVKSRNDGNNSKKDGNNSKKNPK